MRSFYHIECDVIVELYQEGKMSLDTAFKELEKIEKNAYERNPHAEPDGDITYCVAYAVEQIREWKK